MSPCAPLRGEQITAPPGPFDQRLPAGHCKDGKRRGDRLTGQLLWAPLDQKRHWHSPFTGANTSLQDFSELLLTPNLTPEEAMNKAVLQKFHRF